jgi:hypothetical protein
VLLKNAVLCYYAVRCFIQVLSEAQGNSTAVPFDQIDKVNCSRGRRAACSLQSTAAAVNNTSNSVKQPSEGINEQRQKGRAHAAATVAGCRQQVPASAHAQLAARTKQLDNTSQQQSLFRYQPVEFSQISQGMFNTLSIMPGMRLL